MSKRATSGVADTSLRDLPLRERKKQRTRAELMSVSQRLFRDQGYDATTLEQIAEEAEVSVPTLLSYFPSKERLAYASDWDAVEQFRAQVSDPQRAEDTLSLWRQLVIQRAQEMMARRRFSIRVGEVEAANATLLRARMSIYLELEEALIEGLATDVGTDPDTHLPTRLLATTLAFGTLSVIRQWVAQGGASDLVGLQGAVVDLATDTFHHGRRGRNGDR